MGPILSSLITQGLGAALSVGQSLSNFGLQNYMNKDNRKYLDSQTRRQENREDTAYQRAVHDATAAGLSPLSVSGGASSSSPLTAVAQAPQMDFSSALGLALSSAQLDEQKRQFNERLYFDKSVSEKNFAHLADQLRQNDDQFSQSLASQVDMFTKQQDLSKDIEEQKYLSELSRNSLDSYRDICNRNNIDFRVKYFTDLDQYKAALESFSREFQRLNIDNTHSTSSKGFSIAGNSLNASGNSRDAYYDYRREVQNQNDNYDDLAAAGGNMSGIDRGKSYYLVYPIFIYVSKFSGR